MLKYALLGIVQGITEFLPVSSSAHLLIMQRILAIEGQALTISVIMHLGTSLALVIFFFKDILKLLKDFSSLFLIVIVTIITGIIGISGKEFFERLFASYKLAAFALIITGCVLILTKNFMDRKRNLLDIKDAFALGFSQGIAIIPGISRSGITVSTLLFRGLDKETSFRFSFIASLPAVFGATILEAKDIGSACKLEFGNLAVGFILSLLTGIVSLWILKVIMAKARLHFFGYYCILAGLITLIFL